MIIMTKKLFLIRHAEKESNAYEKDISLSQKGFQQALAMGQHFAKHKIDFDRVLCSTALRTQQTLKKILEGMGANIETSLEEDLYYGSTGDMLSLCQALDEKYNNVLIVGHNPLIPQFLTLIATRDSYLDNQHPVFRGQYHPCTVSHLEITAQKWADIQPYENILKEMIYTKDLDAAL